MKKVTLFLGATLLSLVGFTAFEVQASSRTTAAAAGTAESSSLETCWGCRNGNCVTCRVVGQFGGGSTACIDGSGPSPFCTFIGTDCVPPPC